MAKKLLFVLLLISTISLYAESLEQMFATAKPARSSYIGKKLVAFEMNNGPTVSWKTLPNGDTLQYWRSDLAGLTVTWRVDGQGTLCRLIIKTDSKKVINSIKIVEDGIACGVALR